MNFDQIKAVETSLELVSGKASDVVSITNFEYLKDSHLVFIKDLKFLRNVTAYLCEDVIKSMGLICSLKVWEKESESLKDTFAWIATVESADLAISNISKLFFHEKLGKLNYEVDGRQMGSASIHPTAHIASGAFIGEDVVIGEGVRVHTGAVIMTGVEIGNNSEIFPNVVLYPFVKVGESCRIHANTTIGADGFGYNFVAGVHHKVWHMGSVIIEDHVEIGSNSNVDQGTFSPTLIGAGTKIDNQVQIGHNCQVGKGCIFCGHVAIGGSTKIGDYTVFGGKSGSGHGLTLGQGCQVAGGALVNCDWEDGAVVGGHPARPLKEWMKGLAYVRKESLKK